MFKSATPVKQNQGTEVRPIKIILAMPKFYFSQNTQIGTE